MQKKYDDKKSTAKTIDIDKDLRNTLELMALEAGKDLKNFIQDLLVETAIKYIRNK